MDSWTIFKKFGYFRQLKIVCRFLAINLQKIAKYVEFFKVLRFWKMFFLMLSTLRVHSKYIKNFEIWSLFDHEMNVVSLEIYTIQRCAWMYSAVGLSGNWWYLSVWSRRCYRDLRSPYGTASMYQPEGNTQYLYFLVAYDIYRTKRNTKYTLTLTLTIMF